MADENGNGYKEEQAEEEVTRAEMKRREKEQVGDEKGVFNAEIVGEMEQAFIDYAMSVIVDRALPSVEDGLKPVHRRILYTMSTLGLDHTKPTRKSAKIVGECFVKDTKILTTKGLIPIEDIKRGGFVYTQKGIQEVTELYEMPEKEITKITLNTGISVKSTLSQLFKVLNKDLSYSWKEAKDLSLEDYLVIKSSYPEFEEYLNLKLFGNKCIQLNENIAYMLGQFLSDGWIEKKTNRICFGAASEGIINNLKTILQKEFNYAANVETKCKSFQSTSGQMLQSVMYTIRINNLALCNFLANTFGLTGKVAYTKEIPVQIFESPKKVIYSFLSGLIDGDGSVHKSINNITYTSVSEKLIEGVLILTMHLSILGRKYESNKQEDRLFNGRIIKSNYPSFYIEFSGEFSKKLALHLDLADERKKERAKNLLSSSYKKSLLEIIPYAGNLIFTELSDKHLGAGWYASENGNKFRLGIQYPAGCKIRYSADLKEKFLRKSQIIEWKILEKLKKINSKYYQFLKDVIDNNIFFIKINKIEKVLNERTYDFQVKDVHEFIANGIVSHNCMGNYHPHGNLAIYDALVRMAQDFSLRYPLVHGQGNFGNQDGDSPAADRYTEAKLAKISEELLADIEKDTVKMRPNFSNDLKEPETLPGKLPNLLLNGATGIAVGMATNIPPHNLTEVCDAVNAYVANSKVTVEELMEFVKGPDFPTGGMISGPGIKEMYRTGKGKIIIRARSEIEEDKKGKSSIVITEIPYMVNKADLVKSIALLATEKKLQDVSDLRDESARGKIRIVVELKKGVDPKFTLNKLYKMTNIETSFDANLLALVGKQPRVLNLLDIIREYVDYRRGVVRRRSEFELNKAKDRLEIVLGLLIALKHIDDVVAFIKKSEDAKAAHEGLMKKFGLTDRQAKAVLEIRLQQLTHLEAEKLRNEEKKLKESISELEKILGDENEILKVIKKEVNEIKNKYGDDRRTKILRKVDEITEKDLVEKKDVVVMITSSGYIKRVDVKAYKEQRRGGVGVTGTDLKEEDFVTNMITCSTHDHLLFFTTRGRLYWLKAHDVPASERQGKGKALVNVLDLRDESIASVQSLSDFDKGYLMFVTKLGIVKKIAVSDVSKPRATGVRVMNMPLDGSDILISVMRVSDKQEVLVTTSDGKAIRFNADEVRQMGRASYGVKGIELNAKDEVVSLVPVPVKDAGKTSILTVTEKGYGKRSALDEYRLTGRGGKGVINIRTEDRNGSVVRSLPVTNDSSIIATTKQGMVVRISMDELREMGRATQGVRVVKLKEGDKVADVVLVADDQKNLE